MKKILVVVDMQNDFIDGALGTSGAVGIIPEAAAKIRSFTGDIFVTYDTHYENYMQTSEGKKLPVMHCIKGTDGWRLNDEISSALADKKYTEVEKNTFGSVILSGLIEKAAEGEKFSVELIGLCTDICVVSNALLIKANFPDADIKVDASCCAGVTPESHKAALTTMKMCQIKI